MKTMIKHNKDNALKRKGIVLFIATVIASIVSIIGFSVLSVALKEIKLSRMGSESLQSLYMADTGIECTLYWDVQYPGYTHSIFATSTVSGIPWLQGFPTYGDFMSKVKCAGTMIGTTPGGVFWNYNNAALNPISTPISATTTYMIYLDPNDTSQPCAKVVVAKHETNSDDILTTIYSRGYNTCDFSRGDVVERGLFMEYLSPQG